MRRILVTGSEGQVGHELLKTLAPLGQLIAVTRQDADLADGAALQALLQRHDPDVVVNPAAYTAVDRAESDAGTAFAVNATAPAVLAEWAERHQRVLIHYSTDYVYAGEGEAAQAEHAPVAPASVYGQSKLAGDTAVLAANPSALILRTAWVYGARGRNFMLTMLALAAQKPALRVVDDQHGAPTPAWLIAQVTAVALRDKLAGEPGLEGVLHLTCRGSTSWCGFAQAIIRRARESGRVLAMDESQVQPIPTSEYPAPAPRPANSRLDVSRIERILGLHMPDWQAALDITLAELKVAHDGKQ